MTPGPPPVTMSGEETRSVRWDCDSGCLMSFQNGIFKATPRCPGISGKTGIGSIVLVAVLATVAFVVLGPSLRRLWEGGGRGLCEDRQPGTAQAARGAATANPE